MLMKLQLKMAFQLIGICFIVVITQNSMSSDLSYPRKFKFSYPTVDTRTSKKQLSPLYSVDSIKRTVLLNVLLPKKNLDSI